MIDEDSDEFIALDAQVTGHVSYNALETWKRLKQEMRDAHLLVDRTAPECIWCRSDGVVQCANDEIWKCTRCGATSQDGSTWDWPGDPTGNTERLWKQR